MLGLMVLLGVLWLAGLVHLSLRSDIDRHDKGTWLVVLLLLNGVGAVIYMFFGPRGTLSADHPDAILPPDSDVSPIVNSGAESWNPIQGSNAGAPGVGLNPSDSSPNDS